MMKLVSTVTVGSGGAASIEFTNIPQTGKDLLILCSLRGDANTAFREFRARLNGSTSGYSGRSLYGDGSAAASSTLGTTYIRVTDAVNAATSTSSTFNNGYVYVSNYTVSAAKSISADMVAENNSSTAFQTIAANSWTGTDAITSLNVFLESGNLVQHSTASLYIIS